MTYATPRSGLKEAGVAFAKLLTLLLATKPILSLHFLVAPVYMASFTFGSVGDIIAICQIVQTTVAALSDARGSQADYQAFERGLTNLSQVLINIDRLAESKKQVINTASLEQTLRDCYRCLLDFNAKIEKYSRALGAHGQKHSLKDVFRKIVWMNEKEDVATFHQAVCMNLAILQILLQLTSE